MNLDEQLKALIALSLKEDGERDITSEAIFEKAVLKSAVLVAKQDGRICGIKFLEEISKSVDPNILIDLFVEEGAPVRTRMLIAGFEGDVLSLLRLERILVNFLSRLSGIATLTSEYVKLTEKTGAVILDTRKTVPGWRFLDKYAVSVGGGINHRMNLEDIALIKDTHVDGCGSVKLAIETFLGKNIGKPLIVEVRTLAELEEALIFSKSLHRIMLDNFSIPDMRKAVVTVSEKILLEASGNVSFNNVRDIAKTGVHFISVGALTHSAPAFDLSFKIS